MHDHKIMAEMWHIFMLRDTIFSLFRSLYSADVERHQHTYILSLAFVNAGEKRIECNKFFIYSFSHTWTLKIYVYAYNNPKKGEKIANKFEMENLLIMSTVFSMRFITQMLIFQPTPSIYLLGKKSILQIDLYHLWKRRTDESWNKWWQFWLIVSR